jgi:DNA-binding response OmpR family regulator
LVSAISTARSRSEADQRLEHRSRNRISRDRQQTRQLCWLPLANLQFSLLAAFCGAPQRVLCAISSSTCLDGEIYDRSVDVQILRLRQKIEVDATRPEVIVTERGAGYMLSPNVEIVY